MSSSLPPLKTSSKTRRAIALFCADIGVLPFCVMSRRWDSSIPPRVQHRVVSLRGTLGGTETDTAGTFAVRQGKQERGIRHGRHHLVRPLAQAAAQDARSDPG